MSVKWGCVYRPLWPLLVWKIQMNSAARMRLSHFLRADEVFWTRCGFSLQSCSHNFMSEDSRKPVALSQLKVTESSVSMWHALNSPGCRFLRLVCAEEQIVSQVEVKDEFNQSICQINWHSLQFKLNQHRFSFRLSYYSHWAFQMPWSFFLQLCSLYWHLTKRDLSNSTSSHAGLV